MRHLPLILLLGLGSAAAHADARRPLVFPIRDAAAGGPPVPAPAYAGDVVTVRLTPAAARAAWQSRSGAIPARLGVPSVDRIGAELGIRWEPEFPGRRPLPAGSRLPDLSAFYTAHLPPGIGLVAALDRLSALSEVASAEPVAILPVSSLPPSDSLFANSYWFQQPSRRDLHALEAWAITTGDTSIVVGILDTGVLSYHPDIGGDSLAVMRGEPSQIWTNWAEANGIPGVDDDGDGYVDDVHGWDFVSLSDSTQAAVGEDWSTPDNDPSDFVGHGTAVAGLVGALSDNVHGVTGTSWNVRLLPLRIGYACPPPSSEGCGEVQMNWVARAIDYAAAKGIPVLNCSFESAPEADLIAALDVAHDAGVTIVAAAGNEGYLVQFTNNFLSERPEVLSVASIGPDDVLSPFTNYGPEIDLCAPGQQIASTWLLQQTPFCVPTYNTNLNGTSVSAPLVSGAAALVQARQRQLGRHLLTPEGMALRLEETADDISDVNGGKVGLFGAGRVNLYRAVSETWRSTATRIGDRVIGSMAWIGISGGGSRIAFATADQKLVLMDSASLDTTAMASLSRLPTTGVTVGRLGPNGGVGLFVGGRGGVDGYHYNGTRLAHWPALLTSTAQVVSGPAVGDLLGDGSYDVVCGTDDGHVWAWSIADPTTPLAGFPAQVGSGVVQVALAHASGAGLRIIAAAEDGSLAALDAGGHLVSASWQISLGAPPTAPVIVFWGGIETVLVGAGSQLHGFQPDGTERSGFPVALGGSAMAGEEPALGDIDLDGSDDVAIVTTAPDRLEIFDSAGQPKTANNWPRTLFAPALGSPVIGQLAPDAPPEVMVMLASGLAAFTAMADSLKSFPKPGGAGRRPTLLDIDGDGTTDVLAGSGPGSPPQLYIYDAGTGTAASPVAPWVTFRGNFARTGNRVYGPGVLIDVIPPAAVSDLHAVSRGGFTLALLWTAPGDDGMAGRATAYDVRRSGTPITEANFSAATVVNSGPPAVAGTQDSLLVAVSPGVPTYFALRTLDEEGNASPVSNDVAIDIPLTRILLAPARNPARPPAAFTWQADPRAVGQRQTLRIHDLAGRRVRTIELGTAAGGSAVWDGRDDDGRRVPAGLYLARLVSGAYHAQARLVLLP